ncbi:MAG: hypothetical protein FJ405_18485, partial [Verrucomicrobia bacterium]|nr:hypothetical protein [Verrucomicrobiota bacterium]
SFLIPTPRATNNPASPPVTLFINEWMADNTRTLADPVDGQLDDWFEIYNPGQDPVDIGDYYLSDTLSNSNHWKIPDGTRVPGRGYLLVWADNEPSQNDPPQPDLHAGFSLSRSGDSIALFSPDGVLVDGVTFLAQTADVSQGRFPDGSASIVSMTNSTPRSANRVAQANLPPVLAGIGNRSVAEGNTLNIQCAATDPNTPAQELTFTLDAPIPPGASIHPNTGRLLWTPTEAQGPGVYSLTIRVTDNGSPNLSDSETVSITVLEVNNPPVLTPPGSKTVEEGVRVTSASVAADPDGPSTVLRYSLEPGFPPGAAIDAATGLFSWTPTEAQGPGVYSIGIRVTDNGDPELSDIKILTVFVNEVNSAPNLLVPGSQSVHPGAELVFQISATDGDLPAQGIQYSLGVDAPVGASVDVNTGRFSWSVPGQASGLYELTFKAEDTGSPRLSDSRKVNIQVSSPLSLTVRVENGNVVLEFGTIPGLRYRMEERDQVNQGAWRQLGSTLVASSGTTTVNLGLPGSSQRFFRVLLEP